MSTVDTISFSPIRRKRYRINPARIMLFISFFAVSVYLFISIVNLMSGVNSDKILVDKVNLEEIKISSDILDTDFEEISPQAVTLHIKDDDLKQVEVQEEHASRNSGYIVKKGDSLWSIAKENNMSVNELAKINGISPSRILKIGQPINLDPQKAEQFSDDEVSAQSSDGKYIVKKGDSLWNIACKYGIYVSTLQYLNDLKKTTLSVGQKLEVSDKNIRPFKVPFNTTIENLSGYFNLTAKKIADSNNMKVNTKLKKGENVVIPNNNPYIVHETGIKRIGSDIPLWPTNGKIASPFGWRTHPVYKTKLFHNGVDIENKKGTEIHSVLAGKVIFSAYKGNSGKLVIVEHRNGYQSIYAHMDKIKVKKNQWLKKGELIGLMGRTGVSTGTHLHFGIRKNGKFLNPLNYLN